MSRPVLYLNNLGSIAHVQRKGLMPSGGHVISALRVPKRWMVFGPKPAFKRTCPEMQPNRDDLVAVQQGQIEPEEYFRRFSELLSQRWKRFPRPFAPGNLTHVDAQAYHQRGLPRRDAQPLADGDALCCTCARPGSPKRTHACHIEEAAWWLVKDGWDVQLYTELLTLNEAGQVIRAESGLPYTGPVETETREFFRRPRLGESTKVSMPGDGRTRVQNYRSTR